MYENNMSFEDLNKTPYSLNAALATDSTDKSVLVRLTNTNGNHYKEYQVFFLKYRNEAGQMQVATITTWGKIGCNNVAKALTTKWDGFEKISAKLKKGYKKSDEGFISTKEAISILNATAPNAKFDKTIKDILQRIVMVGNLSISTADKMAAEML